MSIIITPGEPAGIGPDICLSLLQQHRELRDQVVLISDPELLDARAQQIGCDTALQSFDEYNAAKSSLNDTAITVLDQKLYAPAQAGKLDHKNARYVLDCLDTSIKLCSEGLADALVTGPVHKGIINQAGETFTGHTEYLAAPSGSQPVMMLATQAMRVVLATTHLPLRDVADAISFDSLIDKISITHSFLETACRITSPQILVCGLNPHAGEDGHLGREEIDIIQPALEHLRSQGMELIGPLPADTAFTDRHLASVDAYFAMYHDQGLPVLKYSGFGKAVNITMGLPFIRTSVDHGTALDLAASGDASSDSLYQAVLSALDLSYNSSRK